MLSDEFDGGVDGDDRAFALRLDGDPFAAEDRVVVKEVGGREPRIETAGSRVDAGKICAGRYSERQ